MQFVNLVNTIGAYDPKTGMERKFTDEMGREVQVNIYALLSRGAAQYGLNQEEIWKKIPKPVATQTLATFNQTQTAPPVSSGLASGSAGMGPPAINAAPQESAILNSVPNV